MGSDAPSSSSCSVRSMSFRSRRIFRRVRIRSRSSPAALRVKVTPSTSSARTNPLATSHTTRSTMVAVLPDPAPAITRRACSGDSIMRICSSVGGFSPSSRAISRALRMLLPPWEGSPAVPCPTPGRCSSLCSVSAGVWVSVWLLFMFCSLTWYAPYLSLCNLPALRAQRADFG